MFLYVSVFILLESGCMTFFTFIKASVTSTQIQWRRGPETKYCNTHFEEMVFKGYFEGVAT